MYSTAEGDKHSSGAFTSQLLVSDSIRAALQLVSIGVSSHNSMKSRAAARQGVISLRASLLLAGLVDQGLVNVRDNTTSSDGGLQNNQVLEK